jgi:hypothetical protein
VSRIRGRAALLHISDDADHGVPRPAGQHQHAPAHIIVGEESARERLIHERHSSRRIRVRIGQGATPHDRNLERREVSRRRNLSARAARVGELRPTLDLEHRRRPSRVVQWEERDGPSTCHAGNTRDLVRELVEVAARLHAFAVDLRWHLHAQGENVIDGQADRRFRDVLFRAKQQASCAEQDD